MQDSKLTVDFLLLSRSPELSVIETPFPLAHKTITAAYFRTEQTSPVFCYPIDSFLSRA